MEEVKTIGRTSEFIRGYYVIEDLNASGLVKHDFKELDVALENYIMLSEDKLKALGIESTTGALDFIQCQNGVDKFIKDYTTLQNWSSSEEIVNAAKTIKERLCELQVLRAITMCDSVHDLQSKLMDLEM